MTDETLESFGTGAAQQLDRDLQRLCGEERGFILLICASPPGNTGTGAVFSNVDPASIRALLVAAAFSLGEPENLGQPAH